MIIIIIRNNIIKIIIFLKTINKNIYTKNSHAKYASYSKKVVSERIRNEYSMLASECKLTTIEEKLINTQVNCIFTWRNKKKEAL